MGKTREEKAITLIALIITIVVLLILVAVAINAVTGDGIIQHATNAKTSYEKAQKEEVSMLDKYLEVLNGGSAYDEEKGVNKPLLKTGMTPVKYDSTNGCWVVTTEDDKEWFDYEKQQWANVMLQDNLEYDSQGKVTSEGSMFVWVPRFSYRITNQLTRDDYTETQKTINGTSYTTLQTTSAGMIEVKFLKGTTDSYEGGTAVRSNTAIANYVVHPSFTSDVNLGGWSSELSGYWVAKYEAGYAGTAGNPSSAQDSNVSYTYNYGYEGNSAAYEYITNNYYGENQIKDGDNYQKIKYPTFTANKSSFNYITVGDSFSLCLALNDSDNPYGIDESSDSHLMKNSEWGAVAYLTHSQYGRDGNEISVNNTTSLTDAGTNTERTVWASTGGAENRSSTENVTGIYDLSGGVWERVASYINNGNSNLTTYGSSILAESSSGSTKYVTVYPKGISGDNKVYNYQAAKAFYGDALTETSLYDESKTGTDSASNYYNYYTGWFTDYTYFPRGTVPFFAYGGDSWDVSFAGIFGFNGTNGTCIYYYGFRAVLV